MKVTASAPGKVALLGEYAVLEGAPALVMAVNRRARVSLDRLAGPHCSVAAPCLTEETGRFRIDGSRLTWLDGDDRPFRLATHIIAAWLATGGERQPRSPFHLVLDSSVLMTPGPDGSHKLGLGSSAALTVALHQALSYYGAMQELGVLPDLRRTIELHSDFQGQRGSGMDIAASLHGGLIEYRRADTPQVWPARIPASVALCFVWSGRAAVTGQFLADIDAWRRGSRTRYQQLLKRLADLAERGCEAARRDDGLAFLHCLDEYGGVLRDLGSASGVDILSAPHRQILGIAKRHGVVYKPCGAGGGDIGVGLSLDAGALDGFRSDLICENFQPLSLKCDPQGVQSHLEN